MALQGLQKPRCTRPNPLLSQMACGRNSTGFAPDRTLSQALRIRNCPSEFPPDLFKRIASSH